MKKSHVVFDYLLGGSVELTVKATVAPATPKELYAPGEIHVDLTDVFISGTCKPFDIDGISITGGNLYDEAYGLSYILEKLAIEQAVKDEED